MFGVKVKYFISRSSIFFLELTLLDFIRPISVVGTSSRSNNKCIICNMREISKYIFSVSCDAEELLSVLGSSSQWQRPSTQTSTSPHFEGGNPLHSLVSPPPPTTAPVTPLTPHCAPLVCWFCLHVVETLVSIFSQ